MALRHFIFLIIISLFLKFKVLVFLYIENEDSDSSISSEDQSEISEKFINDEQKKYQSVDTSSEEEGENHHIVTASVHKIPEDN